MVSVIQTINNPFTTGHGLFSEAATSNMGPPVGGVMPSRHQGNLFPGQSSYGMMVASVQQQHNSRISDLYSGNANRRVSRPVTGYTHLSAPRGTTGSSASAAPAASVRSSTSRASSTTLSTSVNSSSSLRSTFSSVMSSPWPQRTRSAVNSLSVNVSNNTNTHEDRSCYVPDKMSPQTNPRGLIHPPGGKDFSKPLFVDCSIEYELPNAPKIPKNSQPILMVHPGYQKKLQASSASQPRRPSAASSSASSSATPVTKKLATGCSGGTLCDCRRNIAMSSVMANSKKASTDNVSARPVKRSYAMANSNNNQNSYFKSLHQHLGKPYFR